MLKFSKRETNPKKYTKFWTIPGEVVISEDMTDTGDE
jgi:hypothetical protein